MEHEVFFEWKKRSIRRSIIMERWNTRAGSSDAKSHSPPQSGLLGFASRTRMIVIGADYRRASPIAPIYKYGGLHASGALWFNSPHELHRKS
jgi:hypothetical protein